LLRNPVVIGGLALLVIGLFSYGVTSIGANSASDGHGHSHDHGGEGTYNLPDSGNESLLTDVQTFPSQGRDHVATGSVIEYSTSPPTSGQHYDRPSSAGFYTETPQLGHLVHSLEHGAIVIYYDPATLSDSAKQDLQDLAQTHTESWKGVVVAPNPNENPESAYVLTAWTHMLRMDSYDEDVVDSFLAEYIGRGPEHPVR